MPYVRYAVTIYLLSMKNNDKSRRALTVTQILVVQQNKYTLKNLVAIGNPEQNGYMLSNINTFNISSLTALDLTCTYQ